MKIVGEKPLTIQLGAVSTNVNVVVAEMVHQGILGLETLVDLGAALDFARGQLSIAGRRVSTGGAPRVPAGVAPASSIGVVTPKQPSLQTNVTMAGARTTPQETASDFGLPSCGG